MAAACVAVVAVVIVGLVLPDRSGSTEPPGAGGAPYLVRDGDRVEVIGQVLAVPDRPVIYCAASPGFSSGHPPGCPGSFAVTLTGVDLARLAEPETKDGVRIGYARLRGIWHADTIAVDEQSMPPADAMVRPRDKDPVPCPEPTGGWAVPDPPRNELPSTAAAERLAAQQPERFGPTWVTFPDDTVRPGRAWTVPVVLVVSLLQGDVEQARRDLEPLYDGNLCISPGNVTTTRLKKAADQVWTLLNDDRSGMWAAEGAGPTEPIRYVVPTQPQTHDPRGPIKVYLLVVDERLSGEFQKIGLDLLDLQPAVRPIS